MMMLGSTPRNTHDVRGEAYREIMDILRPLDWLDRMAVCDALRTNGEFCFSCGNAQPNGKICDCEPIGEVE